MIFTCNKNSSLWRKDFEEDATLLCTLDRICDDATVFKLCGESFQKVINWKPFLCAQKRYLQLIR